ncbi:hypothetical protein [Reichenbachiella sp.]|uniref:hypothetical protein n=1 Tax=Reichenbachiella sp. TaxID=2184521 RepID=UPI003296C889
MKRILAICIIFLGNWQLHAQQNIHETVYSHLSAQDLIVGETLHFNNYVFSSQTGRLSDLSRLLYIELLDESGQSVHQLKMPLSQGTGSGSIYLPSDLPTGNYHFVAYTRWMKNFGDFYHQRITIVNPYQVPKISTEEEQRWSVEFRAEGGTFLANAKNKVVLRITDQYKRGVSVAGKIISKSKDFSLAVKTDEFGFFNGIITPDVEETYQLILEKDGGFIFHDLPKATAGGESQFSVVGTQDLLITKLTSFDREKYSLGELRVYDNRELILSRPAALNTSISLDKKNLPAGLLRLELIMDGDKPKERLIWNGGVSALKGAVKLGSKGVLEKVNYAYELVDSAHVSVSVEKVDYPSHLVSMQAYSLFENKINLGLSASFYDSVTVEQLDAVLIFAQWAAPKNMPAEVKWLPEHRNGLVQGKVINSEGQTVEQVSLGLALPGILPQMTAGVTDGSGRFVLAYDLLYASDDPRIAVLNHEEDLQVQVEPEFYISYPVFENPPLRFDSVSVARFIQRSIYNQIENAYHRSETDSAEQIDTNQFGQVKSYRLDDYTRFSTIRDTFIELIFEVGVSKNESNYKFRMRSKDLPSTMLDQQPTLILLDGAFVSNQEAMELSPYLVERIDILNRRYYFGSLIFDGIISIHTKDGDRGGADIVGSSLALADVTYKESQALTIPSPQNNPRFPNYQDLVHWDPHVQLTGDRLDLSFYTSEVLGLFEIRIEGVTPAGQPISRRAYFEVH